MKKKRRRDENERFVSIRPFSEGDERGWRCIYFLGFEDSFMGVLFVNIIRAAGVAVGLWTRVEGMHHAGVMGPTWTKIFLLYEEANTKYQPPLLLD